MNNDQNLFLTENNYLKNLNEQLDIQMNEKIEIIHELNKFYFLLLEENKRLTHKYSNIFSKQNNYSSNKKEFIKELGFEVEQEDILYMDL